MGSGIATPSYWYDARNPQDVTGNVTAPPPGTPPTVTQPPGTQPPGTQPPVTPPPVTQPPVMQPPAENPYGSGFGKAWQQGDFSRMPRGMTNFYQNHGYLPPGIARRLPAGYDYSQLGSVNPGVTGQQGGQMPSPAPIPMPPSSGQAPMQPIAGQAASGWPDLNILPPYQAPPVYGSAFQPAQNPYQAPQTPQQSYPTFGPYPVSPPLSVSYPTTPLAPAPAPSGLTIVPFEPKVPVAPTNPYWDRILR